MKKVLKERPALAELVLLLGLFGLVSAVCAAQPFFAVYLFAMALRAFAALLALVAVFWLGTRVLRHF